MHLGSDIPGWPSERSTGFTRRSRVAHRGVLRTVMNHEPSVHYDWATLKPTPAASSFICHALDEVKKTPPPWLQI